MEKIYVAFELIIWEKVFRVGCQLMYSYKNPFYLEKKYNKKVFSCFNTFYLQDWFEEESISFLLFWFSENAISVLFIFSMPLNS
jgi:hypothetical protein